MSDKELVELLKADISYIRGRTDDIATVTSNTAAKVDNHLAEHSKSQKRLVVMISIIALLLSGSVVACSALKEYVHDQIPKEAVATPNPLNLEP